MSGHVQAQTCTYVPRLISISSEGLQRQYRRYCLNRAREQVRCQCLEVLEDAYAVCVTENLLRLLVVNISNVLCRDEKFERIFGIDVANAALDLALDLLLALLPVTGFVSFSSAFLPCNVVTHLEKPRSCFLYAQSTDLFNFTSTFSRM